MALSARTRLGPYEIVSSLGAGGMGEVYRARDTRLKREVALKILPSSVAADAERLRRFEQEARAASALNHPNIVTIYDVGLSDGISYIAMEAVEGKTLRDLVEAGPLAIKKSLDIAAQVAAALSKAHAAGIIHRDNKPDNIMVTRDGQAKILDFGLAKAEARSESFTETRSVAAPATSPGMVVGTVAYMSPEQARGAAVDFRSDVFSFGTVLYEMLSGKRPFDAPSSVQLMTAIMEDDPQPLSQLNPKVPAPLSWIVERCLAKDPEERYASTRDLARDLAGVRDHLSETGMAAAALPAGTRAVSRRLKMILWIVAGVIAGAVLSRLVMPAPESHPVTLRTLTFSGGDLSPSVSPDRRTVAFQSNRDGVSRIWLKQLDTGSEAALTSGPDDGLPRYSPDGSWILFLRRRTLYRVPALGGDPRKLLDNVDEADWSPDGRQLVFLRSELSGATLTTSVGIASSQDGSFQIIRRFQNELLTGAAWSPNGGTIAFALRSPGGSFGTRDQYVRLLSADGKQMRDIRCPLQGGGISMPTWLRSSRELVYAIPESVADSGARGMTTGTTASSPSRIVLQNVDTEKMRVLFLAQASVSRVEAAGPGRMVLDVLGQRENLKELTLEAGREAKEHGITQGTSIDRQPYYSPDGASVVFSSSRSGDVDLWEVSTSNSSLRRLTDHPAVDWDPFITRDNKYLLWSSNRSGNFEIWMAERDGTAPRQITHDGYDAENPAATPDGWIVYGTNSPAHPGLWKVRFDGSQATQLVSGSAAWPDVSPDGQYALYHSVSGPQGRRRISVVRLSDGARMNFDADGSRARFAPDGKSIIYIRAQREIVSQAFPSSADSAVKVLVPGVAGRLIGNFNISPDGKRLVISVAEASDMLMVADGVPY